MGKVKFRGIREDIKKLDGYQIELGIFKATVHKPYKTNRITNVKLLYLLEHGSPLFGIPPRPVLKPTIIKSKVLIGRYVNKALREYIENKDESQFQETLDKLAERLQDRARDKIEGGKLLPMNAQRTIANKGFNKPLYEYGMLVSLIECRITKR